MTLFSLIQPDKGVQIMQLNGWLELDCGDTIATILVKAEYKIGENGSVKRPHLDACMLVCMAWASCPNDDDHHGTQKRTWDASFLLFFLPLSHTRRKDHLLFAPSGLQSALLYLEYENMLHLL